MLLHAAPCAEMVSWAIEIKRLHTLFCFLRVVPNIITVLIAVKSTWPKQNTPIFAVNACRRTAMIL